MIRRYFNANTDEQLRNRINSTLEHNYILDEEGTVHLCPLYPAQSYAEMYQPGGTLRKLNWRLKKTLCTCQHAVAKYLSVIQPHLEPFSTFWWENVQSLKSFLSGNGQCYQLGLQEKM